jgi:hypothetical protein
MHANQPIFFWTDEQEPDCRRLQYLRVCIIRGFEHCDANKKKKRDFSGGRYKRSSESFHK